MDLLMGMLWLTCGGTAKTLKLLLVRGDFEKLVAFFGGGDIGLVYLSQVLLYN
jgi:hypothetical protein